MEGSCLGIKKKNPIIENSTSHFPPSFRIHEQVHGVMPLIFKI